jgi:hypothetical protein
MNPQEKASKAFELMKEAVVDYLQKCKTATRQTDLAAALGLQQDPKKFTRSFLRSIAQQLVNEGRVRTKTQGRSRLYFVE